MVAVHVDEGRLGAVSGGLGHWNFNGSRPALRINTPCTCSGSSPCDLHLECFSYGTSTFHSQFDEGAHPFLHFTLISK